MPQMKKQEKNPETNPNEMEIICLIKKFKEIVIKMLNRFENIIAEMKNTLEVITSKVDEAED